MYRIALLCLCFPLLAHAGGPGAPKGRPWWKDADADGFGSPASVVILPKAPLGYVGNSLDCNDKAKAINPLATEVCEDGIDNNCDGVDDTCPYPATLSPSSTWTIGTYVSSLAGLDLDGDLLRDTVVVGESDVLSWYGAFEQIDTSGLTFLSYGGGYGDAAGYTRAIEVGGHIIGASVNDDLGGTDSGSFYIVNHGGLGAAVYGGSASGSYSAYNAVCATIDSTSMLCGFPATSGDIGAVYEVPIAALTGGGAVSSVATASVTAASSGLSFGLTVGADDLNGDGHDDWIVADEAKLYVIGGGRAGGDTLAHATHASFVMAGVTEIDTGADLDGDGADDVVIVTESAATAYVSSAANLYAGTWAPSVTVAGATEAAVGDFDDDGADDLAWVTSTGEVAVAYGPLSGAEAADSTWTGTDLAEHVAFGDVTGDGIVDLVFSTDADEILAITGG